MSKRHALTAAAAWAASAAFLCTAAQASNGLQLPALGSYDPATANTSSPSSWRFAPGQAFNGVTGALDGVARLSFSNAQGNWACSGSLLAGGQYVVTAAHCADNFTSMTVNFGWYNSVATETRSVAVGGATVHPLWAGAGTSLDAGSDIALLKLSAPVTSITGYNLSTTNDVGKNFLMAGYGTTSVGSSNVATNWGDGAYGHYGYNTVDVDSKTFNATMDQYVAGWGYDASFYVGLTYMSDYDHASGALANNTLARVAAVTGNAWTSNSGLGSNEALIAGGDSGGGDFVWSGTEWLLSGVHSWGWGGNEPCGAVGLVGCDIGTTNTSSYGDLSGSTAVVSHLAWISSTINPVPEPGTWALLLGGLSAVTSLARRRKMR